MIKKIRKTNFLAIIFMLYGLQFSAIACSQEAGKAEDFNLPTMQKNIILSSYKGKVVYLDFWASWCPPCRKSFPWMNSMQEKYKSQGLEIIAVNLDANKKDALKFLSTNSAIFTVAFDSEGKTPRKYGVKGMPTSYLIDRDGKIVLQHMGFDDEDRASLEQKIQELLHLTVAVSQ
jgi:thiol-disulfide isomerase/thioredoxin